MEMRLLLEELDNRGRRNNIHIKGLWEPEGVENLPVMLQALFAQILD